MQDVTGYIYCPPDWDEAKLRTPQASEAIRQISLASFTDISFVESKNSIQITGDSREDVVKAQTELNILFFPPEQKSKKSWARPDRPGSWGQRRDIKDENNQDKKEEKKKKFNKKKSFSSLKRLSPSKKDSTEAGSTLEQTEDSAKESIGDKEGGKESKTEEPIKASGNNDNQEKDTSKEATRDESNQVNCQESKAPSDNIDALKEE